MVFDSKTTLANAVRITSGYGGWCLRFVRECAGIPAVYGNAVTAWRNVRAPKVRTLSGIYPGAFVFFTGSPDGHVAIYSHYRNGVHYCRTTNAVTNLIHTQPFTLERGMYGLRYAGWSDNLNGYSVPRALDAPLNPHLIRRGSTGERVRALQIGMRKQFPAYARLEPDGVFGPATEAAVKEFQRRVGITVDGIVGPETQRYLSRYNVTI